MAKVIVLGGGVGGMSAAHELVERGFEVEVYEKLDIPGGKARSMPSTTVPAGPHGEVIDNLPGEHGFRFFPGFYCHVTDTMKRIPTRGGGRVFDNLVPVGQLGMVRPNKRPVKVLAQVPTSLEELGQALTEAVNAEESIDISKEQIQFFTERVWQLMTSCEDRRIAEYEQLGWEAFMAAGGADGDYYNFFVRGLTRTLVAAKAERASVFTVGDIFLQLMFDILDPSIDVDRVLNGPTNEVWIEPWRDYLKSKNVKYYEDKKVIKFNMDGDKKRIASVDIEGLDGPVGTSDDFYISAVPVEVMADLISQDMLDADPTLTGVKSLKKNVEWMNGMQIYLSEDISIVNGHLNYVESPWALTSISQAQFWERKPEEYDPRVKGILSVDISDWVDGKGNFVNKIAKSSTRKEIFDEVWDQLKACFIDENGTHVLNDDLLLGYHLDPDIVFENGPDDGDKCKKRNDEPLLVNEIDTWGKRPEAYTRIPNLFLASDYVRTNTDLATMEGANEAARRATNCILDLTESSQKTCKIWPLHEPEILQYWRELDQARFDKGLPWRDHFGFRDKLAMGAYFGAKIFVGSQVSKLKLWLKKRKRHKILSQI